jgi:hypothetical protein
VVALVGLAAATGCGRTGVTRQTTPSCDIERNPSVLVLAAQSVPRAARVPCVALVPAGWSISGVEVTSGNARFNRSTDRVGDRALEVHLVESCRLEGSSEVPSDEPGTRRYERIDSVEPGFAAMRFYTFDGGCVSYQFRFETANRALVNEVSLALSFLDRKELAAEVRRLSDGRVKL